MKKLTNRIKGSFLFLHWVKEWTKFCYHTITIWERPEFGKQAALDWEKSVSQGPMKYEYERIKKLQRRMSYLITDGEEPPK